MTKRKKFLTRQMVLYCNAPDIIFVEDPAQIPDSLMQQIANQQGLPCEGSGIPGSYCIYRPCRWAQEVLE